MNGGSLFSGSGVFDCGLAMAGIKHAWGCESDEWRRGLWSKRFNAPCYPDIRELRGAELEPVGMLAGGFPCRGVSSAGKREGFGHPETALWEDYARLVRELRPQYVVVENVAALLGLKDGAIFGTVVGDLAESGFDIWWDCLPACSFGSPHRRDRVFIIAHAAGADGQGTRAERKALGRTASDSPESAPDADRSQEQRSGNDRGVTNGRADARRSSEAPSDPGKGRLAELPQYDGGTLAGVDATRGRHVERRGPQVEFPWGEYEPAIRRWEHTLGRAAPPPLSGVRGLDDGNPSMSKMRRRMDRQRLSALGDGVLVQAGYFVGSLVMNHAAAQRNQA